MVRSSLWWDRAADRLPHICTLRWLTTKGRSSTSALVLSPGTHRIGLSKMRVMECPAPCVPGAKLLARSSIWCTLIFQRRSKRGLDEREHIPDKDLAP